MPPRHYVLGIILFWMATAGWLFQRDLWPKIRPGEPPPFSIDLGDEARRHMFPTRWKMYRNGEQLGKSLETEVHYVERNAEDPSKNDTFELISNCKEVPLGKYGPILGLIGQVQVTALDVESMYRVTRDGNLREITAAAKIEVKQLGVKLLPTIPPASMHLHGIVEDGKFIPDCYVIFQGQKTELKLEPVDVALNGNVLNPLHPVNRISGLRPGQHWKMPIVDPLGDALTAMAARDPLLKMILGRRPADRVLAAEVLPGTQKMDFNRKTYECLVIEFTGDNLTAHTWVRQFDGLVLKQEASLWGEQIEIRRD